MGKSGTELLRLVEALHRDRDIEKEIVFRGIEAALVSAARKHFGGDREISVHIDRETGELRTYDEDEEITPSDLGRIAAQTAKQVIIQKIREAEREVIIQEMTEKLGSVVSGRVQRVDGLSIVVDLSRTEGFLPRSEQIAGEVFHTGERIRAMVLEVKPAGSRVRVILSRSRPEFVHRLFELEVPEVADGVVEVRAVAREAGYRSKVAVSSLDPQVDCVGACVGVQGNRIRNVVAELSGEKIDIVRWSDEPDVLIAHALKPAEVSEIRMDEANRHAEVIVPSEQLSLAIGKRGQNVRLVCKLIGWDIDIRSAEEEKPKQAAEPTPEQAPQPAEPEQPQPSEQSDESSAGTVPAQDRKPESLEEETE